MVLLEARAAAGVGRRAHRPGEGRRGVDRRAKRAVGEALARVLEHVADLGEEPLVARRVGRILGLQVGRDPLLDEGESRDQDVPAERVDVGHPGSARPARELGVPGEPARAAVDTLQELHAVSRRERLLDGGDRLARRAVQLGVRGTQGREGVLVPAEPHVQPVLEDAPVRPLPSGRALAAEPPAHLVDGDVVLVLPAGPGREVVRRRERAHASAQDRDLATDPVTHRRPPSRSAAAGCVAESSAAPPGGAGRRRASAISPTRLRGGPEADATRPSV